MRVPVQARAVRTRSALLTAAVAEFAAHDYGRVTAKTIANRAGVATGTFYQYFPDKDALLRELAGERFGELSRALSAVPVPRAPHSAARVRPAVERMVTLVMDYHRRDPGLHAVLEARRHADGELAQLTALQERAVVERLAQLLPGHGKGPDAQARAFILYTLVEGAVHSHVLGSPLLSDDLFATSLCDAVLTLWLA